MRTRDAITVDMETRSTNTGVALTVLSGVLLAGRQGVGAFLTATPCRLRQVLVYHMNRVYSYVVPARLFITETCSDPHAIDVCHGSFSNSYGHHLRQPFPGRLATSCRGIPRNLSWLMTFGWHRKHPGLAQQSPKTSRHPQRCSISDRQSSQPMDCSAVRVGLVWDEGVPNGQAFRSSPKYCCTYVA